MEEVAKALSDIPAINRFLSYCRIRTVPSKTVIIHAGDLPDILYYIISGSVEVMIEDEDGNEMVLAYLNKGQFFGEMGLFYEQPTRSAWVRTRQQSELAEMTYPRFRQIAAESPGTDLRTGHPARDAPRPDQPQTRRPRVRRCHRPGGARDHGSVRRAGRHDAPRRHADQSEPAGAVATGRLLARNGRTRAEGARGTRTAARHRQDHRRFQRPSEGEDSPAHRSGESRRRAPPPATKVRAPEHVDDDDDDDEDDDE